MTKTRITTLVGTRPELIRLSSIIKRFDEVFEHRLVNTNQNSDSNLLDVTDKRGVIVWDETRFLRNFDNLHFCNYFPNIVILN